MCLRKLTWSSYESKKMKGFCIYELHYKELFKSIFYLMVCSLFPFLPSPNLPFMSCSRTSALGGKLWEMAGIFGNMTELVAFSPNVFVHNMSLWYWAITIFILFYLFTYTKIPPFPFLKALSATRMNYSKIKNKQPNQSTHIQIRKQQSCACYERYRQWMKWRDLMLSSLTAPHYLIFITLLSLDDRKKILMLPMYLLKPLMKTTLPLSVPRSVWPGPIQPAQLGLLPSCEDDGLCA